ncbi:MOSC domain-containing protein [Rothia terrae]|uniref:MOSC domain-containing protein n=1 Tax=Rothia terrae TaxID=396015 RepID=UPI002881245E|nr:MOSC domain-containing protein [Rothia terrae]MDT0189413.1 MOSC domain-containing protein [Rothia terrae]
MNAIHQATTPQTLNVLSTGFALLKGTRHEPRTGVQLTSTGVKNDRRLCLIDATKKQVLRTVQHQQLMAVRSELDGDNLRVTFPDGKQYSSPLALTGERLTCEYWGRPENVELISGPLSEVFTYYLRKPVQLAQATRNVVYDQPLTLVGTASLQAASKDAGRNLVREHARFRSTLLVETEESYIEETWANQAFTLNDASAHALEYGLVGGTLADTYSIRIGAPIPRCAVIDAHPETGKKDARILKSLAKTRPLNDNNEPCFGVYAQLL